MMTVCCRMDPCFWTVRVTWNSPMPTGPISSESGILFYFSQIFIYYWFLFFDLSFLPPILLLFKNVEKLWASTTWHWWIGYQLWTDGEAHLDAKLVLSKSLVVSINLTHCRSQGLIIPIFPFCDSSFSLDEWPYSRLDFYCFESGTT